MEKIKSYYLEITSGALLVAAAGYFCYALYCNQQNQIFLSQARSKVLLMEARQNRAIEEKLNEQTTKNCRACFENSLEKAGFIALQITHNLNYISAVVENNPDAKAKLLEILENVQYIEDKESLEIRWFFDATQIKKHETLIKTSEFILNGICYFGKNSWQVWIDGKSYDASSRKINDFIEIEDVTSSSVVLKRGADKITLELS